MGQLRLSQLLLLLILLESNEKQLSNRSESQYLYHPEYRQMRYRTV